MLRFVTTLGLLCFLLSSIACRSTRVALDYLPNPGEVFVPDQQGAGAAARVLASVISAERRDRDPEQPFELRLRLRLENLAATSVAFEPAELLLVGNDLRPFGPPRIMLDGEAVEQAPTLAAGMAAIFDLFFPVGDVAPRDVEGLNLRLMLLVDGRRLPLGFGFGRRRERDVLYGTYDPYYPWYGRHAGDDRR